MIFNLCSLPHNNKIALKLNDFNSFKRYLINQSHAWSLIPHETIRWRRYYRNNIFYPPIIKPTTIEEHQLCHYALWMVISKFNLSRKPKICIQQSEINLNCYACEWANHNYDIVFTASDVPSTMEEVTYTNAEKNTQLGLLLLLKKNGFGQRK